MTATEQIDQKIENIPDWQKQEVLKFRALVHAIEPTAAEEWKWGTGMWSLNGIVVCGFGSFQQHVKFNFFAGALLQDNTNLFNNGFAAKTSRSIDIKEGKSIDQTSLKRLIEQAFSTSTSG